VPFGFLKRKPQAESKPAPAAPAAPDAQHRGSVRGVPFTAITEDWRLRGRMEISGRLSDALNRREAITISDVSWGPPEAGAPLDPAPDFLVGPDQHLFGQPEDCLLLSNTAKICRELGVRLSTVPAIMSWRFLFAIPAL